MKTYETTVPFARGLEEWDLEVTFSVDSPDPSVGITGYTVYVGLVEFYNDRTRTWQPFALTDAEVSSISDTIGTDFDLGDGE